MNLRHKQPLNSYKGQANTDRNEFNDDDFAQHYSSAKKSYYSINDSTYKYARILAKFINSVNNSAQPPLEPQKTPNEPKLPPEESSLKTRTRNTRQFQDQTPTIKLTIYQQRTNSKQRQRPLPTRPIQSCLLQQIPNCVPTAKITQKQKEIKASTVGPQPEALNTDFSQILGFNLSPQMISNQAELAKVYARYIEQAQQGRPNLGSYLPYMYNYSPYCDSNSHQNFNMKIGAFTNKAQQKKEPEIIPGKTIKRASYHVGIAYKIHIDLLKQKGKNTENMDDLDPTRAARKIKQRKKSFDQKI